MKSAVLHFDGACRNGNPGRAAGGAVLSFPEEECSMDHTTQRVVCPSPLNVLRYAPGGTVAYNTPKPVQVLGVPFHGTNNEAEYQGLLVGLKEALARGVKDLTIFGDSKLVVEQVCGRWHCSKPHLLRPVVEARAALSRFDSWSLTWVPREQNKEADKAANIALDKVTQCPQT